MKIYAAALIAELQAMRLFVSEDESRYVLTGIFIEIHPGATLLVATDGRRLAVLKSAATRRDNAEKREPAQFIFPTEPIDMLIPCKSHTRGAVQNHAFLTFDTEKKTVAFDHQGGEYIIESPLMSGNYPNWRQVVPKSETKPWSKLVLNADFVSDYTKAAQLLADRMPTIAMVQHEPPNGPFSIRLDGVENFYSVLMPVRNSEVTDANAPGWIAETKGVAKA